MPTAAVQHGPKGLFVYVVGDHNRAAMRPVTVSHENTENSVVTQGVNEGDRVVTVGPVRAAAGRAGRHRTAATGELRRWRGRFRTFHPPSGRDHADDGGDAAGGPGRLSAAARGAAAADRLPDDHGQRLSLPGASPDTMASSVAQPLERQIAQIPGVSQMTSTSSLGATAITVQFDLDRNIDAAANDIQGAINAASGQLPKNLPSPPTYRKVNPSDTPILILSVTSDVEPIIEVDDVAENILAQRISQIAGVSLVRVGGQQQPGDPHPDRSGQAGREEPAARGRARADRRAPRSTTRRARSSATSSRSRSSTTIS